MGQELVHKWASGVTRQLTQHLGNLTSFQGEKTTCSMMLIFGFLLHTTSQSKEEGFVLFKFSKHVNLFILVPRTLYQMNSISRCDISIYAHTILTLHTHTLLTSGQRQSPPSLSSEVTFIHKTVITWANIHCWRCRVEQWSLITSVCRASHERWRAIIGLSTKP